MLNKSKVISFTLRMLLPAFRLHSTPNWSARKPFKMAESPTCQTNKVMNTYDLIHYILIELTSYYNQTGPSKINFNV